jgi:hypothetical protein
MECLMRLLAPLLVLLACPAAAEEWQIMYLADSGGSRPMQVGPGEGGVPVAYVDSGQGERLFLECRQTGTGGKGWTLKLYPGDPPSIAPQGEDGETRLFAGFDGNPAQIDLGPFAYVQQAFWADVAEEVARQVMAGDRITISASDGSAINFSLAGALAAITTACP